VSNLAFRVKYLRRSREIRRRYLESKPWLDQLYSTFLDIRPGQKIVDVGCGPGDFTRYLARLSGGKSKIIGIDSNPKSIKAAIADTKRAKLTHVISYKIGDVHKIPVNDNYADLACCRTLLMHLTDPLKAIKEMTRITRTGGSVAAVEIGITSSYYDPNDESYSRLADQAWQAWTKGLRKLESKDFRIGEKLPGIFQRAGLTNIKAEAQSDAYLTTDPRQKPNDVKASIRFNLSMFKERMEKDRKYFLAGGLSRNKITAYNRGYISKMETLLSDDQKLLTDPSISTSSLFIVSGMKNRLRA